MKEEPVDIGSRIRLPKKSNNEMYGYVISKLGGTNLLCYCEDGKERLCRIPGRLKRRMWIREGDYVIIRPLDIEGEKKGEVLWRYKPIEVDWLRKKGYLKALETS